MKHTIYSNYPKNFYQYLFVVETEKARELLARYDHWIAVPELPQLKKDSGVKIFRVRETLLEAFGSRFFGFGCCFLLPSLFLLPHYFLAFGFNVIGLTIIRFTLMKEEKA